MNRKKKFSETLVVVVYFFAFTFLVSSCSLFSDGYDGFFSSVPDDGMVHGVSNGIDAPLSPFGMVYVPSGVNIMGHPDENSKMNSITMRQRNVTIDGFWMDETEITNNEYRQFVYWVLDSITAKLLGYSVTDASGNVATDGVGNEVIDWSAFRLRNTPKATKKISDDELVNMMAPITVPKQNLPFDLATKPYVINTEKVIYHYEDVDFRELGKAANRKKPLKQMVRKFDVPVYPDTFVWLNDFTYSLNEPISKKYWSAPSYGNFPVVGVNWNQAVAFCNWRTMIMNSYLDRTGKKAKLDYFRLPSEYEWEYAAKGGRIKVVYPWGNPYLRNKKGCLFANFKPRRGDYAEDGANATAPVDSYWPNDFGLYNMSGNVAEWTSSVFYEGSLFLTNDLNPNVEFDAKKTSPIAMKRKVVKGGSWKDVGVLLQLGNRTFEYQDSTKSHLGFRSVISLPVISNEN